MGFSIKIRNTNFEWFNEFTVELNYSTIASKFSFQCLFESSNYEHRQLFKPFSYHDIDIYYDNKLILTGTMLNINFESTSTKTLVKVEGYSKSGILEDCNVPKEGFPLTFSNLTYKEIFEKLTALFNISVVFHETALDEVNKIAEKIEIGESETIADFITKICIDKGLIISHNELGQVLITKLVINKESTQTFYDNEPSVSMSLSISGQNIYSHIYGIKEQGLDVEATENFDLETVIDNYSGGADESIIDFIKKRRPINLKIENGNVDDLPKSIRKKIGSMVKSAIRLKINTNTVLFRDNKLFRPNHIIKVKSNDLYLFEETDFFIDSVILKQGISADTAILSCITPMSYSEDEIIDIFN